jgi:hypothetical protein
MQSPMMVRKKNAWNYYALQIDSKSKIVMGTVRATPTVASARTLQTLESANKCILYGLSPEFRI